MAPGGVPVRGGDGRLKNNEKERRKKEERKEASFFSSVAACKLHFSLSLFFDFSHAFFPKGTRASQRQSSTRPSVSHTSISEEGQLKQQPPAASVTPLPSSCFVARPSSSSRNASANSALASASPSSLARPSDE